MWAGVPLLVGALITMVIGGIGGQSKPTAHLLVADEDQSFLSGALLGAFGQGPLQELVRLEKVEAAVGRARMEAGEATALLIVPAGFGQAALAESESRLYLLSNPSQRILPAMVEQMLEVMLDLVFYAHRLFAAEIKEIAHQFAVKDDLSQVPSLELALSFQGILARLSPYFLPPAIELQTSVDAEQNGERIPFSFYFFPGTLLMALFFAAQELATDLWEERRQGTFRRLATTPQAGVSFLLGKVLAGVALVGLIAGVLLLVGMLYHQRPWSYFPLALVWTMLGGGLLLLLVMVIQLLIGSEKAASLTTQIALFPLLMLGGSFFPLAALPGLLATLGGLTPNGWILTGVSEILLGRMSAADLLVGLAGLLAANAALFALCALRLRRLAES